VKDDVWLAVAAMELVADDIEGKRRKKSAGERERERERDQRWFLVAGWWLG
jgi:hypothetical protein